MISLAAPWAMYGPSLEALGDRLADPKALQAVRPERADRGQKLGIQDGVGVLYVTGTLVKRESIFTALFGGTTYEILRRDLQAALEDPKINAIALYVDSPGGEVAACDELATAIFEARKNKPTAAYVSGMGCSAAYWLASAAERVVLSDAAIVGSIGVAMAYSNSSAADEKRGIRHVSFVSSQSPNKGFVPAKIQKMVDDLGNVFIAHVARYRRVTTQTVVDKFGAGGVLIGANAVKGGMADAVGSFETMLADLRKRPTPMGVRPLSAVSAKPAAAATDHFQIEATMKAEQAARAALARVNAIMTSEPGKKSPDRAAHFAHQTTMPAKEAVEALRKEQIAASWKKAADFVNESRSWR